MCSVHKGGVFNGMNTVSLPTGFGFGVGACRVFETGDSGGDFEVGGTCGVFRVDGTSGVFGVGGASGVFGVGGTIGVLVAVVGGLYEV